MSILKHQFYYLEFGIVNWTLLSIITRFNKMTDLLCFKGKSFKKIISMKGGK